MIMNVEYSLGPFCNWFLPSCLDIWSSRDGQQVLCSYGARSMVCLMSITETKALKCYDSLNVFNNNKSIISCNKFNKRSHEPFLFIGSNDGEAAVLECNTRQVIYQKETINDFSLPSKKVLSADWCVFNDNSIVYYSIHSLVICWNLNTKTVNKLKIGENYENKIAISCIVASHCGQQKLAIGYMNGDIIIITLENMSQNTEHVLSGHNDDICSLAFSWSKGHYEEGILSSASRDGFVKVWDVYNRHNIADLKLDANKLKQKNWFSLAVIPMKANEGNKSSTKFEILIGSGNGDVLYIEIPTKPPDSKIRVFKPLNFSRSKTYCHNSVIFSISVDSRTMTAITTSLDHNIVIWDLIERKSVNLFNTFSHGVHDISFSPIAPYRVAIAIGECYQIIRFDEQLNVVNQRRYQLVNRTKDIKTLAIVWHPIYENRLAYGSSLGDIVVIDLNSSQKAPKYSTKRTSFDNTKVYALLWGPSFEDNEESTLYSVHQSGRLYLHYITSNKVYPFTHYINDDIKRTDLRWKANFKHLCVGNDNGTVDVFENVNKKLLLKVKINSFKRSILCLRWNSNKDEETSNWLAVSSYDNNIHCFSLNNYLIGNQIIEESDIKSVVTVSKPNCILRGHCERVSSMDWCPYDSNKLVSVSYDMKTYIWDVLSQSLLTKFTAHKGLLYCVHWSPFDSNLVFSGGEDNYLHVWRPSKQIEYNGTNGTNELNNRPRIEKSEQNDDNCVEDVLKELINRVVLNEGNLSADGYKNFNDCKRNKQKNKKKKINKEVKKSSLFPMSNTIENCSTKCQNLEDIESLFNKLNGKQISSDQKSRILLYGDCDDIKQFISNEISYHIKQENKEQKDIVSLLYDIKLTIEESIQQNQTNPYLVSLSSLVSRNHWKELSNLLAQELLRPEYDPNVYSMYRIEMSAILLLSQNNVRGAIDLLISNHLFRESLIVAKTRLESEEVVRYIMNEWATYRLKCGDTEGAAKCLTSIRMFSEAAEVLKNRNDQQFSHTISLLKSINI